jgi:PAS domain S-box-containing protein
MTKKKAAGERETGLRAVRGITKRKRAEEALRESEEQWRSLVEYIPDIIMTLDRDGTILFINRTPPGFTANATIGAVVYDHVPLEHHDTLRRSLEGVFESGDDHDYEIAAPGPFGRTSWYFNRIGPIVRDGRVVAAAVIATDITERKRAEQALRESEERFRGIFELAFEGIVIHENGVILDANPAFEKMYRYQPSELVGMPILHLTAKESRELALEKFRSASQETYEAVALRKDGTTFRAEVIAKQRMYKGRRVRVVAVRDITERKRAEETLRESEERYRDLVEDINDIVFSVDAEGRITYMSPVVTEVGGYSPSEMVGRPFADFLHPEDVAQSAEGLRKSLSGGHGPHELRFLSKSGELHWMRTFGRSIRDGDRVVGLRGVLTDITGRKRAEEALRNSEERFRSTLDGMMEGCLIIGFDWRYLYANDAIAGHTRRTKEELLGHTLMEMHQGIENTEEFAHLRRCMEERVPHRLEWKYAYPDGVTAWFDVSVEPVPEGIFALFLNVTERKRAEEALRQSEERYRHLVENINEAIYEVDASGRITYISPVVEEVGGYSPSEIVGRPAADFVHPDDLARTAEGLQRAVFGHPTPNEYRLLSKTGEVLWVRSFGRPIFEGDRVVGVRGVLTDITERKQAEDALRESEERYRDLAENLNDAIFEFDTSGRMTYVSRGMEEVSGRSAAEMVGRPITDLAHPEDLPAVTEKVRERPFGNREPSEYRLLTKSGEERWVQSLGSPLFEGDRVVGFRAALTDITERKLAEDALRESEERWRSLVENAPDIILMVDVNSTILFANRTVPGLTVERVIGTSLYDYLPAEHHDGQRRALQKVFETGEPESYEIAGTGPLGRTSWYLSRVGPVVREGKVVAAILITTDITEQRQTKDALRESEERYRELVELSPYAMVVHSDEKMVFVNSAGVRLFGADAPDEIIGRCIWDFVHPDHLKATRKRIRSTRRRAARVNLVEEKLTRLDGQVVDVEMAAIPITYQGKAARQVVLSDITERKRMEEALRRTREELDSTVEGQMQRGTAYGLTFRELTVLHLVADGRSDKDIGTVLGISNQTAHKHVASILSKMRAASRTEASVRAVRERLLE